MKREFPVYLLDSPLNERIMYFKDYTCPHPFFAAAYKELLKRINTPSTKSIFLVYGPSGVGKSSLLKKVYEKVLKDNKERIEKDQGCIPIAGFESIAPDNGKYDWKDHYIRSLMSLKEPLIKYKVDIEKIVKKVENRDREPNRELRRSLENALEHRKCLAFLIDEAQHITFNSSAKSSNNQLNLIKSLVSTTNTPHILAGTYEILDFRDSFGQLSRRSLDIHFRRYDYNIPKEREMFYRALWNLQKHLPLHEEPNLIEHWQHFYQVSVGCIGLLKDLLTTTLEYNLKDNPKLNTLVLDDFKEYELTANQTYQLADEALNGEALVKGINKTSDDVATLLGMNDELENKDPVKMQVEVSDKNSQKRKVGERNPGRDVVGGN